MFWPDVFSLYQVVHSGVGDVKPRDVRHALIEEQVKCPVLCFNVKADKKVLAEAKHEGVDVKNFSVVFDLFDEVKNGSLRLARSRPKRILLLRIMY